MPTNLLSRARSLLNRKGVFGLAESFSAYTYNQFLFNSRIQLRAQTYRLLGHEGIGNPFELIWVDPNDITLVYDGDFNQKKYLGKIKSGDWDKEVYPINESPTYRGIKQRYCDNKDWKQTDYYKNKKRKIENQGSAIDYHSISQFEERLAYIDRLYRNIRDNGYKSQKELEPKDWDQNRHPIVTRAHRKTGEVGVNIDREGRLLHNDGIHRLSIAQILDIDEIPVQVVLRHEKWQEKRNQIIGSEGRPVAEEHPDIQCYTTN